MSVTWPIPADATIQEIRKAMELVIDEVDVLSDLAVEADESLAEVEAAYIARKALRDNRRTDLDRALYKVEVLQTRLNDIGG